MGFFSSSKKIPGSADDKDAEKRSPSPAGSQRTLVGSVKSDEKKAKEEPKMNAYPDLPATINERNNSPPSIVESWDINIPARPYLFPFFRKKTYPDRRVDLYVWAKNPQEIKDDVSMKWCIRNGRWYDAGFVGPSFESSRNIGSYTRFVRIWHNKKDPDWVAEVVVVDESIAKLDSFLFEHWFDRKFIPKVINK